MQGRMSVLRTALIGAAIVMLGPVSLAIYTPALPELAAAFSTSPALIQLTVSIYFLGFACAQLVCGPLSDAFGRRPVAIGFFSIYVAGGILGVMAPTVEWLLAARALQGVGVTAGVGISRAIVRDQFSGREAARILNLIGITLGAGPAVAPTLGGALLIQFGWQAIFVAMLLAGMAAVIMLATLLVETNRSPNRSAAAPTNVLRNYCLLLRDGSFRRAGLILACTVGGYYAVSMLLAFVLIEVVGLTPVQFGIAMLASVGSYVSGGLANGWLMHRVAMRVSISIGIGFVLLSGFFYSVGLTLMPASVATVMLPAGLWAFGVALVMPSVAAIALEDFPQMAGSAGSLSAFMQIGGGLVGSAVAALLFPDALAAIKVIMPLMAISALVLWLRLYRSRTV